MNKLWHLKTQRRLVSSSAASDVATDNLKDDEKLAGRRTELFFFALYRRAQLWRPGSFPRKENIKFLSFSSGEGRRCFCCGMFQQDASEGNSLSRLCDRFQPHKTNLGHSKLLYILRSVFKAVEQSTLASKVSRKYG